jgi:hypothetical protein
MKNRSLSILDLKLHITEDFSRYSDFEGPHKLLSFGQEEYLYIPGINLSSKNCRQYFYIKDLLKFEEIEVQREMIKRVFLETGSNKLNTKAIASVAEKTEIIKAALEEYKISINGASVLILYDTRLKEADVYFTDISYLPHELQGSDLKGLEIFLQILNQWRQNG